MKVFWSRCGHGHGNFGDKLTPLFLDYFNIRYEWALPENADLIGIGSLIEKIPDDFKGVIWSTGCMFEATRKIFPKAEVLALRGRLTRERTGVDPNIALGDGGLLSDLFYEPTQAKFKLGLIPHFADQQNPIVAQLAGKDPRITIIDVCAPTLDVIQRVGECEHVLSSSLHGLILADSLGVPNHWIEVEQDTVSGAGFKFRDYYSSFGLSGIQPRHLSGSETLEKILPLFADYARPGIGAVKTRLRGSLEMMAQRFGADVSRTKTLADLRAQERRGAEQRESWNEEVCSAIQLLEQIVPAGKRFILVDEEQLRPAVKHADAIPFLEKNGEYWGAPENDEHAVVELKRLTAQGVGYIAFAWPAFWWLESYPGLNSYLAINARSVFANDRFRIFKID